MGETLGVIGVGQFAEFVIRGLRGAGDGRRVLLSPRNATVAAGLARDCACEVMRDNQAVADGADVVILATRPADALAALGGLQLRPGQLLVSAVAGLPLAPLAAAAPGVTIVRAMPVACAAHGVGPIPIHPEEPRTRALFGPIGSVVALGDERQFDQALAASCVNGWVYRLVAELQVTLQEAGFEAGAARTLMAEALRGAAVLALAEPHTDLRALADRIASPGTYTLTGLEVLTGQGAIAAWGQACEAVLARVEADRDRAASSGPEA